MLYPHIFVIESQTKMVLSEAMQKENGFGENIVNYINYRKNNMSNLANKPPLGQKEPKKKKNEKFLNKIREMRCCVCQRFGEIQNSPTTAHHPIHDRYSTRKRSDGEAIPLCEGHHQGLWDNSKIAIHKEPKLWQETYGPDWSYSVQDTDT